jgi:hypothetical protein
VAPSQGFGYSSTTLPSEPEPSEQEPEPSELEPEPSHRSRRYSDRSRNRIALRLHHNDLAPYGSCSAKRRSWSYRIRSHSYSTYSKYSRRVRTTEPPDVARLNTEIPCITHLDVYSNIYGAKLTRLLNRQLNRQLARLYVKLTVYS